MTREQIGSHGHSVFRELHDALQEWAYARNKQVKYVLKGENCYTEMYSAIKADFEIIGDKRTQRDPLLEAELQSTQKVSWPRGKTTASALSYSLYSCLYADRLCPIV